MFMRIRFIDINQQTLIIAEILIVIGFSNENYFYLILVELGDLNWVFLKNYYFILSGLVSFF
jgi:hypothetical protein